MTEELVDYALPDDVPAPVIHEPVGKSPGDFRTESIAHALDEAYKRASTLELSEEEAKALSADFPDEAFRLGAGGDPDLIYIEHAYLRQRLNEVLGVGASVPIRRREWSEAFTYWGKDGKQHPGVRIYVDLILLIRGCVVGEAIGDAVYYPENPKTNYSDALEAAKSNALRRCCKEFGIGLQAWMKGWGEGWKQRNGREARPQTNRSQPAQQRSGQQQPAQTTAVPTFMPPPNWPTTTPPELVVWVGKLTSIAALKTGLGMFVAEPSVTGWLVEWEAVMAAVASRYRVLTSNFTKGRDRDLEQHIRAHLEKIELDKQANETFSPPEQ